MLGPRSGQVKPARFFLLVIEGYVMVIRCGGARSSWLARQGGWLFPGAFLALSFLWLKGYDSLASRGDAQQKSHWARVTEVYV